jgi:hypothetical protein
MHRCARSHFRLRGEENRGERREEGRIRRGERKSKVSELREGMEVMERREGRRMNEREGEKRREGRELARYEREAGKD